LHGKDIRTDIEAERQRLAVLRAEATAVIDTAELNVHGLRSIVLGRYGRAEGNLAVTVMSFGFKYGLPLDADHVVDVRFLPNPHWVAELRPRTGLDEAVSQYVLSQDGAKDFLESYATALQPVLNGYLRERKRYATVAVGCTGGKHRSVALAEALAERLGSTGASVTTIHRDLGRE